MRDVPLILFGLGGVGRSLVKQILALRSYHAQHYGLALRILSVCDRDGAIIETGGLEDEILHEALVIKEKGGRLTEHLMGGAQGDLAGIVDIAGQEGAVVVDCTASDATLDALLFALERGYKIALANKKPLTGAQEDYDRLTTAQAERHGAVRHLGRSRWETTVGAGLPVISTLTRLQAAGDPIRRMAGAFSGTLGYVMTGLQAGKPFSEIVREAHALGYTEPDPRDDLGGIDVARKALILARGAGVRLDMAQVSVTSLYPASMEELSVPEFLEALPSLDDEFRAKVNEATAANQVLRFAATIELNGADGGIGDAPGDEAAAAGAQCAAGPVLVDGNTPLGRLSGTDNLVEFHTRWYDPNPLVIQGRGAGADATAAGVLSDVLELAYTDAS